ncbi:MAG TPA: hypothetical protein DCP51_08235 [Clostridiales bacterium]|nr:hypothetical protein [Clostridiales bacterium]
MNLRFFIKFTKAEWAEDIKSQGKFYFNPAYKFFTSPHYSLGQYDPWDSHVNINAKYLVYAPIIEENERGIKYGPGKKLADEARIHLLDNRNKNIPICCFRMVNDSEIKDDIFKIDSQLYVKICDDFPEYDSFALIWIDAFFDILSKSQWGNMVYGHWVYYDDTSEFDDFYQGSGEEGFEDKYPYLKMFNKERQYEYQQEFRLILPAEHWVEGKCIEIGSLNDIVLVGKIKQLNAGFRIKKRIDNDIYYCEFEELL